MDTGKSVLKREGITPPEGASAKKKVLTPDRNAEGWSLEYGSDKPLILPRKKMLDINWQFESLGITHYEPLSRQEQIILSLWGHGYTMEQICRVMNAVYDINIRNQDILHATDKLTPVIAAWRTRPLERMYPILYLDCQYYNVKNNGRYIPMTVYNAMGYQKSGKKELLGLWVDDKSECSTHWAQILTEVNTRNTKDIIYCSIDGLAGLPGAIKATFKDANVQLCHFHLVQNIAAAIAQKDKKKFCDELRSIYYASSKDAAWNVLTELKQRWPAPYVAQLERWETHWPNLSHCYDLPQMLRKIIYTTNPLESVHSQDRSSTKPVQIFSDSDLLVKRLWLSHLYVTRKWSQPIPGWAEISAYLSIMYPDRFVL